MELIIVGKPLEIRVSSGFPCCDMVEFKHMMHNGVGYAAAYVHLYWRAEGSSEWKLMRCDTDYLFNRDYEGYIWDETTNFVAVNPESWH